ncbi:MAG: 16S rRNA (cytosine(1402)-N(4))-methyltransferase RsmH [Patescibacteria group bacterium]
MRHVPVLLNEVIESLQLKPGMNVIDCTLGDGSHAEAILKKTAPNGRLLGIDADPESLLRAKNYLYEFANRVAFVRDNFSHIKEIVIREQFGSVNGILSDLGWSSPQFAERGRGFSFLQDEPLDMRYSGAESGISNLESRNAARLIAEMSELELEKIFREYGEEKLSQEIVESIAQNRTEKPIERTGQLVKIILDVYKKKLRTNKDVPWVGGLHPATKVFQALRIAVNHEWDAIEELLAQANDVLVSGGRLAIITFHSGEDRIVKHRFKQMEKEGFRLITKKPIVCSEQEYKNNPRARSAKLRVIQKN